MSSSSGIMVFMWRPVRQSELVIIIITTLISTFISLLNQSSSIPNYYLLVTPFFALLGGYFLAVLQHNASFLRNRFAPFGKPDARERLLNGNAYLQRMQILDYMQDHPEDTEEYEYSYSKNMTVKELPQSNLFRTSFSQSAISVIAICIILQACSLVIFYSISVYAFGNLVSVVSVIGAFIGSYIAAHEYRKLRNIKEQAQVLRNVLIFYRKKQDNASKSRIPIRNPALILRLLDRADEHYEQLLAAKQYEMAYAVSEELQHFDNRSSKIVDSNTPLLSWREGLR